MADNLFPANPRTNDSLWDLTFKLCRALFRSQGLIGGGSKYVGNTSANNGTWFAIQALEDTVFSAVTSDISGLPNNLSLSAGIIIYGNFTAFTLASGKVIAYAK
jgi:hypothetical protein